jgi:hypothetical protein
MVATIYCTNDGFRAPSIAQTWTLLNGLVPYEYLTSLSSCVVGLPLDRISELVSCLKATKTLVRYISLLLLYSRHTDVCSSLLLLS